ncbi:hypothetical protein SETIT_1G242600v2 [Setaria italica]|uniref:Uncharacterized protein n=1 Tax=Setaria italica TaxID=4555 RepID=A0A368PPJ3_SETIT|nr:hypothetical protein SETIT_1G242600v2 [Setaria italica]
MARPALLEARGTVGVGPRIEAEPRGWTAGGGVGYTKPPPPLPGTSPAGGAWGAPPEKPPVPGGGIDAPPSATGGSPGGGTGLAVGAVVSPDTKDRCRTWRTTAGGGGAGRGGATEGGWRRRMGGGVAYGCADHGEDAGIGRPTI